MPSGITVPGYRGLDQLFWIAQQFFRRHVLGKFCPQESFVRRVLEQAPNQISHAGQQLANRTVFPDAIPHLHQRALDGAGHAVKQLELEPAGINAELIRDRLRVRDAADVM